ncbi:MAG TPA: hypothetical protein VI776_02625 [Anaerolineales bacterium]|nr:hypothetical protein [Anaerolineales bacterium]
MGSQTVVFDPPYFVWKSPAMGMAYRVVRREVKTRTSKGHPVTYMLKSVPRVFESWEKAQQVADRLNRKMQSGEVHYCPNEEISEIE